MAGLQPSQPDHEPGLQAFHRYVRDDCQRGVVNLAVGATNTDCVFVPTMELRGFFGHNNGALLKQILVELLGVDAPRLVDYGTIQSDYILVFAILLCTGKGDYIRHFVQHESLNDRKLPFEHRPNSFPTTALADKDLWAAFDETQWMFCTPHLSYAINKRWHPRTILPFLSKESLSSSGSSAVTYRVDVHPAYNCLASSQSSQQEQVTFPRLCNRLDAFY